MALYALSLEGGEEGLVCGEMPHGGNEPTQVF